MVHWLAHFWVSSLLHGQELSSATQGGGVGEEESTGAKVPGDATACERPRKLWPNSMQGHRQRRGREQAQTERATPLRRERDLHQQRGVRERIMIKYRTTERV